MDWKRLEKDQDRTRTVRTKTSLTSTTEIVIVGNENGAIVTVLIVLTGTVAAGAIKGMGTPLVTAVIRITL